MKKYILLLLTCLIISGCQSYSPEKTMTTFLEGVKAKDSKKLFLTYGGKLNSDEIEQEIDVARDFLNGVDTKKLMNTTVTKMLDFDYKIDEVKTTGSTTKIKVTITTYAFAELVEDWIEEYRARAIATSFSGANRFEVKKKAVALLTKQVKEFDKKEYSKQVTFTLKKKLSWKVQEITDEQKDAISGGLITLANELKE